MCQNHFHILVSKFTQLSLEFVRRVHCNRLLIQIVPWIHNPRTEKSIPPDPSSFFIRLVSVPSGSVFHTDFEELVCDIASFPVIILQASIRSPLVLLFSKFVNTHLINLSSYASFPSTLSTIDQVCRSCYYQLRQLRVIARSLTFNAAVSLVHAFVFSRLDYFSSIFVGLPGVRMEKLRRVHRAAARLIGGFRKFDHISHYMRDVLHWLPFPQRISYRIASLVWRGFFGLGPSYLREFCRPLSSCSGRCTLRSSAHGNLVVPFARSATMQTRSFSVVGPKTWNGLPADLRHLPI